jgi:hypothetical protein
MPPLPPEPNIALLSFPPFYSLAHEHKPIKSDGTTHSLSYTFDTINRKLASRLYTSDLTGAPEAIVRRELWPIVAGYFPDALIADRTALDGAPAKDGSVFLISQTSRSDVTLPGYTLRPRRGIPAQPTDLPFMGVLRLSSPARALRDQARRLAPTLGRDEEFAALDRLIGALQRGVFMMFLVAEVHPFADGNGRVARIMMNAELVAAGEQRIVIPTIYRANYLSALKAATDRTSSQPVIAMLDFAQRFTLAIDWTGFRAAEGELKAANAFMDSAEADDRGIRLRLPKGGR